MFIARTAGAFSVGGFRMTDQKSASRTDFPGVGVNSSAESAETDAPTRRKILKRLAGATGAAALGLAATRGGGLAAKASGDRIVVNGLDTSTVNDAFLAMMRQGGAHCVLKTASPIPAGTSDSTASSIGQDMASLREFIASRSNEATVALSVRDIRKAYADGKISFIFGFQNSFQYLFNEVMTKGPFSTYDAMTRGLRDNYDLGLRVQGITYNITHFFGGGNTDDHVPMTTAGRRFVEEIHKLRIALDVGGHTGEETTLDAIAMSKGVPVVATHTNIAVLNDNLRADSDRVLEAIAGTGGVIGLSAISDFHTRNPSNYKEHGARSPLATLDMHLDQYDYLKKLVGVDHIGVGPDFISGWSERLPMPGGDKLAFPAHAMSEGVGRTVQDFEDISKLPNLVAGLKSRGWSEEELDKVLGANWLRVYKQIWGE